MKSKWIIGFVVVATNLACTKEVIVQECKLRKITSVTVLELPSGLDIFSNPDLRCDIAQKNSSYWSYPSFSVDNVSGLPITISFQTEVLMSKETWSMRLVDYDPTSADDIIFTGDFDPYAESDGAIRFKDGNVVVMELNYYEVE